MLKRTRFVILLSISSDIGMELAKKYLHDGFSVIGTYRNWGRLDEIKNRKSCRLVKCDLSNNKDIESFLGKIRKSKIVWNTFISCPAILTPLAPFFQSNYKEWEDSFYLNSLVQLRILHGIYGLRDKSNTANAVFFAGGGVNNTVLNMSSYTAAKILLMKMCELLDSENKDMNVFIVGPGFTKTKIHLSVLKSENVPKNKLKETQYFLKHKKGTSMDDIYNLIAWLTKKGKAISGGRNFSVVNDQWRGKGKENLVRRLRRDPDMYKLRRYKNES